MTTKETDPAPPPGLFGRLSATLYDLFMSQMEREVFGAHRQSLLQAVHGQVLDVGAGTGANLTHYPRHRMSQLVLLDPSPGMLQRARDKATELGLEVDLVQKGAEDLPFPDASFDAVVFTLSLCTIPDVARALREANRVLRPDGRLLVLEHVRARDQGLAAWQDRLTPFWKVVAGGCHLNRDTRAAIEEAGFEFETVEERTEKRVPVPIVRPWLTGTARKR